MTLPFSISLWRRAPLLGCLAAAVLFYTGVAFSGSPVETTGPASPDSGVPAWMQGISLVKSGEITKGVRLLDSMRTSGLCDEAFLRGYAECVFHTLVPRKADMEMARITDRAIVVTDTISPASYTWNVVRSGNSLKNSRMPCFTYGATFEIRKPFQFVFSGLRQSSFSVVQIGYCPCPAPFNSIVSQLENRKDQASCRLFIDMNATGSLAFEYLSKRISGVYDSIAVKPELQAYRGLSLRCYTVSRFADKDGKFTAIASFDRALPDQKPRTGQAGPAAVKSLPQTVRYTLVVESSSDVKDLLEAKFQSLLRAFL
jgi:hypothetical protein